MGVQEQEHLWGGETTKAVDNFPVSGETVPVPVVHWLARIKGASARVNAELGLLETALRESPHFGWNLEGGRTRHGWRLPYSSRQNTSHDVAPRGAIIPPRLSSCKQIPRRARYAQVLCSHQAAAVTGRAERPLHSRRILSCKYVS